MNTVLTARDLIDAQRAPLKLEWLAGKNGGDRLLEPATAKYPGLALVGHLNFVHPNRVQVVGSTEINYLSNLSAEKLKNAINEIFGCKTTAVTVTADIAVPDELKQAAEAFDLPLIFSPLPSPVVIEHLQYYLTRALAPRVTEHGVYMEVMGMGVFITGESGIGKSELALELLSRNHRLIADDAVEFIKVGPDVLVGQCPEKTLSDYMEVRGLGIINVRDMFGETAVRHKKKLHLILRQERLEEQDLANIDRLQAEQMTRTILGVEIPEVILYVAPGRNLAVLVEAATRAYILRMWGMSSLEEFMKKQRALLNRAKK